ncbi:hypothetical protein Tco_1348256 [Tanacetum coccineum]
MEVEPLDQPKIEDVGLDIYNHDIPLSSKEVPSIDEPEPQLLVNFPSLDISLREERGPKPSIKPHSLDSFRMKVIFDEKKLWSSYEFHMDDSWMTI